jgi:hypothetical protein
MTYIRALPEEAFQQKLFYTPMPSEFPDLL